MCGHRSGINNNLPTCLYTHFNGPHHSILNMKVRILEKIYHPSNSSKLSRSYRKQREHYWMTELGTAMPYGCNDNILGVGNLSSPRGNRVNVMGLFNSHVRRRRSHGHRHGNTNRTPKFHDLLPLLNQPLGVHKIRTSLFACSLQSLRSYNQVSK